VKVIAALSESATVPPTWRNYRYGDARSHTGASPTGTSWPHGTAVRCTSTGMHSATLGRCCSGAGVHFPCPPAHGGFSAPRTRVHDGDLVVERIRRKKPVAKPSPIERLPLGKALWLDTKAPLRPRHGEIIAAVKHVRIQVPPQRAHHGPMVPLCDVHRQGRTLRHRVDVVLLRGYNFLVPAHGGFSAPRTRVHDKDLVVKRIRRGKSVVGPMPIERLHLGKAL